jgi:hypothetical protein
LRRAIALETPAPAGEAAIRAPRAPLSAAASRQTALARRSDLCSVWSRAQLGKRIRTDCKLRSAWILANVAGQKGLLQTMNSDGLTGASDLADARRR